MLNWLFSRPLQIKFFLSTILLFSAGLLVLMLNVSAVAQSVPGGITLRDMQERTHILAMALMEGPAAHDPRNLRNCCRMFRKCMAIAISPCRIRTASCSLRLATTAPERGHFQPDARMRPERLL